MNYTVQHKTWFAYAQPVPFGHNLARLVPRETDRQTCRQHRMMVEPAVSSSSRRLDYFGNVVDYYSVRGAHRRLQVTAESVVMVHAPPAVDAVASPAWDAVARAIPGDLSAEGLQIRQLTFASPKVRSHDTIRAYVVKSFPTGRPIVEALLDLNARIHKEFVFDNRATTINTPLDELMLIRRGVCQDFAHLMIGCLRSLGLAARYVSGYICTTPPPGRPRLVGADASHAWVSAFCGPLGWIDIDPTNNVLVGDGHVTLAWGRDYDDVCPIQGVLVGGGEHSMGVSVDVVPLDSQAPVANVVS
jgi:transglutaminase-like putative cysteine protease